MKLVKHHQTSIHTISRGHMNIWLRRFLAFLQIGGGFWGMISFVSLHLNDNNIAILALSIVVTLIYVFGSWAGILLLEENDTGIKFSKIHFMIQIPYLMSPFCSFYYYSGGMIIISFGIPWMNFQYLFGSGWHLAFLKRDEPFTIGINLVALVALFLLYRISRRENYEKEDSIEDLRR